MKKFKAAASGIIRILITVAVLAAMAWAMLCVLTPKEEDAFLPMHNYYTLPEGTVDVLMIGSSHIGMNVSSAQLFDSFGIAAYRCWASIQPVWNSYYYLRECVDVQRPRMVVLDVHGCIYADDYADYERRYKNVIGMNPGKNKWEAVKESSEKDEWMTHMLSLPVSHTRYSDISLRDFQYFPWNRHTEIQFYNTETSDYSFANEIIASPGPEEKGGMSGKCEIYLRAFIEYCQEQSLPLLLVSAPYNISHSDQLCYLRTGEIAAEYNVPFVDFNTCYADYGIDPSGDYFDAAHFNKFGIAKYTRAIGELLQDFELPDRRQDAGHVWNRAGSYAQTPDYALTAQFVGDGRQEYLDTGVQLFKAPYDSWTLMMRFAVEGDAPEQQILDAYDERQGTGHGLRIFRDINRNLVIAFDAENAFPISGTRLQGSAELAVVKWGTEVRVYFDGHLEETFLLSQLSLTEETMLLGCRKYGAGGKSDFSQVRIEALEVYGAAQNAAWVNAWDPEPLPEPEKVTYVESDANALVRLSHRFTGDGRSAYIDTGLKLYEDPRDSWTLLADIDPVVGEGDIVYFACFAEDEKNYRGIIARTWEPGVLNIIYGAARGLEVPYPTDRPSRLVIRKDRYAYRIYLNGEIIVDDDSAECDPYDGDLYIGCECDLQNNIIRYSGTTLYHFEVVKGAMTESAIQAWDPDPLPLPESKPGMDVTFALETGFAGDGREKYYDTGIRLYDQPDKSWTLSCVVEREDDHRGTVLACYADEPSNYRGLLLSQSDRYTFDLVLGTGFASVTVPPKRDLALRILKAGNQYEVYVDDKLALTMESGCASYEGSLYLGARKLQSGVMYGYSAIRVRSLEITPGISGNTERSN